MKALIYQGERKLAVQSVPAPQGAFIVRVSGCDICGTDLKTYLHGHPNFTPPCILGHEFVGTVERAVLEYGDNLTLGSFHHARLDDTCGLTAPCLLDVAIIGVDDSGLVHARREVHGSLED